jgi:hypothetical protein
MTEVFIREVGKEMLQILISEGEVLHTYFLPKNAHLTISIKGGNGGNGGEGGIGGSGGGEDENGNCGSSGSDGEDGYGGNGGDGGNIKVYSELDIRQLSYLLTLDSSPGLGGRGQQNGSSGQKGIVEYNIVTEALINQFFNDYLRTN